MSAENKNDNNDKNSKLTDHNYDGIQEFDNVLPRWWLATFYMTIIFSVGYFAYYQLGSGKTINQEYKEDLAALTELKGSAPASSFPDESKLASAQKKPEMLSQGHSVFQTRCISCHGDKAQGIIGPNLTDNYWLHGDGKPVAIAKTIHDGVPEKGMPPWGPVLSEDDIYALVTYIHSLKGTNPAGAKAPQGELVKE